jgi:probable rRNA maturation factor
VAGVARSEPPAPRHRTLPSRIVVEVANRQRRMKVQARALARAVQSVLAGEKVRRGQISLAVVDGRTMRRLNRRFLNHDYDTDVLSFRFDEAPRSGRAKAGKPLEGEIIVSADQAMKVAKDYGWSARQELLLYVVHGALHLAGYDDKTAKDRAAMRTLETRYLLAMRLTRPLDEGSH